MRLFFGVFPDVEARSRVEQTVRALQAPPAWKMVPIDQYHMTVVFVGKVRECEVPLVRELGGAQRAGTLSVRFDRWEYWKESGVVAATASEVPQALVKLRSGLAAALVASGIGFDDKPLRPHITVARKVTQAPGLQALSEIVWTAREFSLVASARGPAGSFYTVIGSWPLLDTATDR